MTLIEPEPATTERNRQAGNAFVRKMAGLADLSESDIAALTLASAHCRCVLARSDLVRQGDVPDGAWILLRGFACRYQLMMDGRRSIISFVLPGDLCDLDSALLGRMDCAIGTLTTCSVAHVTLDALASLAEEHCRVRLALRLAKLEEQATLRDWVVSLGRRFGPERLAHLLCETMVRLEAVGLASAGECDLPISQTDLADAMGLSTVHANRSLQALRSAGLIQLAARKLRIIDFPGLCSLCDFPSVPKLTARRVSMVSHPVALGAA